MRGEGDMWGGEEAGGSLVGDWEVDTPLGGIQLPATVMQ